MMTFRDASVFLDWGFVLACFHPVCMLLDIEVKA